MIPFNTRVVDRDGQIVYQRRAVYAEVVPVHWFFFWIQKIVYTKEEWYDCPVVMQPTYRVGDRIRVRGGSFSAGSMGEIKYIEPYKKLLWVLRDGATKDVYYAPEEVELIWRRPDETKIPHSTE
jgi:hypothetical protein